MTLSRVLVTGGAGFIGYNLIKSLSRHYECIALDNLSLGGNQSLCEQYASSFVVGDIRDSEPLESILDDIDCIVHLAAFGSVVDSIDNPRANYVNNVQGTFNLLELAAKAGVKRLILASTGGALMGNAKPPVDENSLPHPISPYGASKLCCEAYCHAFCGAYDIDTTILRFANIYGPHSQHKKGVVNAFMSALKDNREILIFGDGTSTRDYLYVEDLCDAIALVLTAPESTQETYHVASGGETSIQELAMMICDVVGKPDHPIVHKPSRRGEVEKSFASFAKANRQLGFQPKTPLDIGLKLTWEWFDKMHK